MLPFQKKLAGSALAILLSAIAPMPVSAQKEKLPKTFVCIHCNIKMTIKKKADWKKTCWVCKCKQKALDCQPKPK